MNPEDRLSDEQAAKLANFALTQVHHLLPSPLPAGPSQLEIALQEALAGLPTSGARGAHSKRAAYNALKVLELHKDGSLSAVAREAALLARLALASNASCGNASQFNSTLAAAKAAQDEFLKTL